MVITFASSNASNPSTITIRFDLCDHDLTGKRQHAFDKRHPGARYRNFATASIGCNLFDLGQPERCSKITGPDARKLRIALTCCYSAQDIDAGKGSAKVVRNGPMRRCCQPAMKRLVGWSRRSCSAIGPKRIRFSMPSTWVRAVIRPSPCYQLQGAAAMTIGLFADH